MNISNTVHADFNRQNDTYNNDTTYNIKFNIDKSVKEILYDDIVVNDKSLNVSKDACPIYIEFILYPNYNEEDFTIDCKGNLLYKVMSGTILRITSIDSDIEINANIVTEQYTITYKTYEKCEENTNGEEIYEFVEQDYSPNSYNFYDEVNLYLPQKEGYKFDGWYETESFEGNKYVTLKGAKGDKLFYGKWDAKNM